MRAINLLQLIVVCLLTLGTSFANAPLTNPPAPGVIGYSEPYEINVCESEWATFELNLDANPAYFYRWDKFTDQSVLDQLDFSQDNTRVKFKDASALPHNVSVFLAVQAVDAAGCESTVPTLITLVLVPELELIAMPLDTVCAGRPFPIKPTELIEPLQQSRVESLSWNFRGAAETSGGDSTTLETFIMAFDSPGLRTITMEVFDNRGCKTEMDYDFEVLSAPPPPNILPCEYMGPDSILFEWTIDDAYTYTVDVGLLPTGATVEQTPTSLLVTNIGAGPTASSTSITVTALGTSPAPCNITQQTSLCRSCLPVSTIFDKIEQTFFCTGDPGLFPVKLIAEVGSNGVIEENPPAGNWVAAPYVDFINGEAYFNPEGLAPGDYTVEYEYFHPIDNCSHPNAVNFTIFNGDHNKANASLSDSGPLDRIQICAEEDVIIYFDTYADSDKRRPDIFTNDMTGSVSSEKEGANSERLMFDNLEADYEVYVAYNLPGCDDRVDTLYVSVTERSVVNVECGAEQTDAVTVTWNSIDDAGSYQVFIDGVADQIVSDTTATISGLPVNVDYEITIEPIASAGPQGCFESGSVTCRTGGCVPPNIDLSNLDDPFCYDPNDGPLVLDVDITSAVPGSTGTYIWDTPLIDADNNFYPSAGQELYTFDILYTEGTCTEILQAVSFIVVQEPIADLTLSTPDTICITQGIVDLTAILTNADPLEPVTYELLPIQGVNPTMTGDGQWILVIDQTGSFDLKVKTTYRGCEGPEVTKTIFVDQQVGAPVVTCTPVPGGIELTWEPPTYCVSAWDIEIDGQNVASTSNLSYSTALEQGQSYEIVVVALANGCVCGNQTSIPASCMPDVCPDIDITTFPVDTCYNPTLAPFDMPVMVVESPLLGPGSGEWTGQLINGGGQVDVSQTGFGDAFTLEYTYTQDFCSMTVSEVINLSEPPSISMMTLPPDCPDDSLGTVIVNVTGGTPDYTYTMDGFGSQTDGTFPDVPLGIVAVEVMDAAGCIVNDSDEVLESSDFDLELMGEELIVENNDAEFTILTDVEPSNIKNITWILNGVVVDEGPDLLTLILTDVDEAGTLEVVMDYGEDCMLFDAIDFDINALHSIYIPNMVNMSGTATEGNDQWMAFIKGNESFILSVQIFDRWGNQLKDYENKNKDYFKEFLIWDGYYGSEPADQGVYTYVIETEISDDVRIKRGSVTILR